MDASSHTIADLLAVHTYTNRRLVSVAGMLTSVSAAVYMAPLYIRKLYQSTGKNMDDDVDTPALAREDLQYWYDNIEQRKLLTHQALALSAVSVYFFFLFCCCARVMGPLQLPRTASLTDFAQLLVF